MEPPEAEKSYGLGVFGVTDRAPDSTRAGGAYARETRTMIEALPLDKIKEGLRNPRAALIISRLVPVSTSAGARTEVATTPTGKNIQLVHHRADLRLFKSVWNPKEPDHGASALLKFAYPDRDTDVSGSVDGASGDDDEDQGDETDLASADAFCRDPLSEVSCARRLIESAKGLNLFDYLYHSELSKQGEDLPTPCTLQKGTKSRTLLQNSGVMHLLASDLAGTNTQVVDWYRLNHPKKAGAIDSAVATFEEKELRKLESQVPGSWPRIRE